jgi:hypothetical protein
VISNQQNAPDEPGFGGGKAQSIVSTFPLFGKGVVVNERQQCSCNGSQKARQLKSNVNTGFKDLDKQPNFMLWYHIK